MEIYEDKQKEFVVHLLRMKDVAILLTDFGKSLIHQLYVMAKEMQMHVNVVVLIVVPLKSIMKDQIQKMEELGIPCIILSTKDDVLLPIGEVKYKFVFGAVEDLI